MAQRRNNPFARPSLSASGIGSLRGRPQSAVFSSPSASIAPPVVSTPPGSSANGASSLDVGVGSLKGRPQSAVFSSPSTSSLALPTALTPPSHSKNLSLGSISRPPGGSTGRAQRSDSKAGTSSSSGTFAPSFIKTEEIRRAGSEVVVDGIEGENDFSGKRYVWLKDPQMAFVKGWIVEELGEGRILVQCDDGTVSGR